MTIAQLAFDYMRLTCELKVLKSGAGFYLGGFCQDEGPISRESEEYWSTQEEAEAAKASGQWTQRTYP